MSWRVGWTPGRLLSTPDLLCSCDDLVVLKSSSADIVSVSQMQKPKFRELSDSSAQVTETKARVLTPQPSVVLSVFALPHPHLCPSGAGTALHLRGLTG